MTCSLDDRCAKYWSDVSVHRDGSEMTDGIYRMFVAGLRQYIQRNNDAPNRIFFYRDGVGEGQIVKVNFVLFVKFLPEGFGIEILALIVNLILLILLR